jgi:hypothetical protein
MKNISENKIKLFKSSYQMAISELELEILQKEIELEDFFDNSKKSTTSCDIYTAVWCGSSYRDKNLFKRYNELKRSIREAYDKLEEYKTTYNNFILELNESNRN